MRAFAALLLLLSASCKKHPEARPPPREPIDCEQVRSLLAALEDEHQVRDAGFHEETLGALREKSFARTSDGKLRLLARKLAVDAGEHRISGCSGIQTLESLEGLDEGPQYFELVMMEAAPNLVFTLYPGLASKRVDAIVVPFAQPVRGALELRGSVLKQSTEAERSALDRLLPISNQQP